MSLPCIFQELNDIKEMSQLDQLQLDQPLAMSEHTMAMMKRRQEGYDRIEALIQKDESTMHRDERGLGLTYMMYAKHNANAANAREIIIRVGQPVEKISIPLFDLMIEAPYLFRRIVWQSEKFSQVLLDDSAASWHRIVGWITCPIMWLDPSKQAENIDPLIEMWYYAKTYEIESLKEEVLRWLKPIAGGVDSSDGVKDFDMEALGALLWLLRIDRIYDRELVDRLEKKVINKLVDMDSEALAALIEGGSLKSGMAAKVLKLRDGRWTKVETEAHQWDQMLYFIIDFEWMLRVLRYLRNI